MGTTLPESQGERPPAGALEDLLVLELSGGVAGAYCTRLLAGLGAEVIKVERPGRGDITREETPMAPDSRSLEQSALFHHLNGCKKSVCLNLESPRDRGLLRRLIRQAHVVVESFGPGRMAQWGLDHRSLAGDNPGLVMTSITSFGQEGPYRDYTATPLVGLAMGGMLHLCGEPGEEPQPLWGTQAGYLAGVNAAVATLVALEQAQRTGLGQGVDLSMVESVVAALQGTTVEWSRSGEVRRRQGNRPGRSYPMTLLPCQDGYVGVMVAADEDWELFARMSGLEELAAPRFSQGENRHRLADEIEAVLRPYLAQHTRRELYLRAQEVRIPFSMALTPQELLADPQHQARGFFTTVQHPEVGEVLQLGGPFRMSGSPWRVGRAPLLGEHTEEVLSASVIGGAFAARLQPPAGIAKSACADQDRQGLRPLQNPDRPCGPGPAGTPAPTEPAEAGFATGAGESLRAESARPWPDAPLEGIRVLDLTGVWAGPLCTLILADLGAEVLKVEAPHRPDGTRRNPGLFSWLNRNKRSVTLDLTLPSARARFRRLVAGSDVVVENFSPRVMRNFGLDYPRLKEVKPDLVMLSMPAYGSQGPYAQHGAYGPGLEASSGLAVLTGLLTGKPRLSGSAYGDPVAGLHGAVAVLAALAQRRRTGRGQWIELAQREALSHMFGEAFLLAARGAPSPENGHEPPAAPYGCYRCRGEDRWIALDCRSEAEWQRLCAAMGRESLSRDPSYRDAASRRANRVDLRREIESWTRRRDCHQVMGLLQAAGVAAGVVMDARDLGSDPHLAARGFFLRMSDVEGDPCDFPGRPWRATAMAPIPRRPAPKLGERNPGDCQLEALPAHPGHPVYPVRFLSPSSVSRCPTGDAP